MRVRPVLAPLVAALLLTAVVAAPSVAQTPSVHRWLGDVGVLAPAASFTELSLAQHQDLPSTVDPAGHTAFSFLATNVAASGSRAKSYTWSVTVGADQAGARSVGSGRFTLPPGASITVPVRFTIPDCRQRNLVSVAIQGPDARQPALHYWVIPHRSAEWKASGGPACGV